MNIPPHSFDGQENFHEPLPGARMRDLFQGSRINGNHRCPASHGIHAFTLVEILVVTVILSILVALTLQSVPMLQERKNQVVCAANLRGISAAISAYSANNDGYLPSNNSKTTWWKEIYPDYCSSKAVFSCPADRTGFTDPADIGNGKQSYGPLGWDGANDGKSAFNKRMATFSNPMRSVVLAEYFSTNRSVTGSRAWNYPGTVASATYPHYNQTKTALLFLDGHVSFESEADIRAKIAAKELFNSF